MTAKEKKHATDSEQDKFLREIVRNPDDDFPRLAYADWLAERDDPRGEFIHVQCQLAQIDDNDPRRLELEYRERMLMASHRTAWARPLGKLSRHATFERGFPSRISISTADFIDQGAEILKLAPIQHVRLAKPWQEVERLAETKLLKKLKTLNVRDGKIGLARLKVLLASKHLKGLSDLELGYNGLAVSGLRELCNCKSLTQLKGLGISSSKTDAAGLDVLLHSEMILGMHELRLNSNPLDDACLAMIASSESLRDLRLLTMEFSKQFSADGLQLLFESTKLPSLRSLSLRNCHMRPADMKGLEKSESSFRLWSLNVDDNSLESTGFQRLATADCLDELVRLSAGWTRMKAAGLEALLGSKKLRCLRELNIPSNGLDQSAVKRIANWERAHQLTTLNLSGNAIGDAGVQMLANAESLSNLTELRLEGVKLTNKGAVQLAKSPHLNRLTHMWLTGRRYRAGKMVSTINEKSKALLTERFGSQVCRFVQYD